MWHHRGSAYNPGRLGFLSSSLPSRDRNGGSCRSMQLQLHIWLVKISNKRPKRFWFYFTNFSNPPGFCPRNGCTCTAQGALIDAPPKVAITGKPIAGLEDYGLCDFVCSHGYCPDVCVGTGSGSSGNVYYPPNIWEGSQPHIPCLPPCKVILPPYPIGSATTITFSPRVTSVWTVSAGHTGTKTTTITLAPLVTDAIPFWPITVGPSVTAPVTVFPLQSFMPPAAVITLNGNEATFSPVPSGSATPAPSFPGTERPVTIQPQATSSVTMKNSVPSVT